MLSKANQPTILTEGTFLLIITVLDKIKKKVFSQLSFLRFNLEFIESLSFWILSIPEDKRCSFLEIKKKLHAILNS
jgi:hypothetical protein